MRSNSPAIRANPVSVQKREGEDVLAPVPSNIRTIWASAGGADIVTRMRNAPLGQLYRDRLKQYTVVRGVARWIWWNLFPLYVRASVLMKKRYRLIALIEYVESGGVSICKLVDAESVAITRPKVFPAADQSCVVAPNDGYRFPEIFVATIKNGTVMGGTNLVLVEGQVVCHDLLDCEHDATAEEQHGRALISPKSRRIRLVLRDKQPASIPLAATFVDACASNYAHWMTEVLPRVALFCAEARFKDVPIVVNEGLHPNIMESLFLVAGADREVIALQVGKALAIEELYLTSVVGYVPFERRVRNDSHHSHGMFSPRALRLLRDRLATAVECGADERLPEKIFLRRNSGVRTLTNAVEIERLLVDRGYVIVEPETLTFSQQARYFAHAKVIVGATGAGFANAIFCKSGTRVAVLISKCTGMAYNYWVNMLSPIGVDFSYVLGDIVENHAYGVHGDFKIHTSYLMEFLEDLEQN